MADRRNPREGSVFYDEARGRWVGQVDLGADPLTGKRRRPKVIGKTRADVVGRLKKLTQQADEASPIPDGNMTFGEFLDRWRADALTARPTVTSTNTTENYDWAIDKYLKPGLGTRRVRRLTTDDIEAVLKAMAAKPLSRSSVNRVRSVASMALKWGEARGLVARNVAELAEIPAGAIEAREGRSLTLDEAQRVIRVAASDDSLGPIVLVGLTLGLRPQEVCAIKWSDMGKDKETGEPTLKLGPQRRKQRGADGVKRTEFGKEKTRKSRRTLKLPEPTVEALKRQRAIQARWRLAAGPRWNDLGLIFSTRTGKPIEAANLRRLVRRLARLASLEGGWTPYELFRHSAASILSALGVPREKIAEILGHNGTRMLDTVYLHEIVPVDAAVAPMGRLVAGKARPTRRG